MTIMGYRDDLLAGRVALVTGAARGIGLATGRAAMLYALILGDNYSLLGTLDPDFSESRDTANNFLTGVEKAGPGKALHVSDAGRLRHAV